MLARGVRNVIYNYTDAQRKVRSATSNDAWGPSPALMHEIADLTDNVVAYAEIMPIIWKRLNDHGKNWRHVYKSLVLLDYLIKYGNERVSQQCKENIFAIQTLKDFQYIEDQKDQGFNVREKAKQLVALLKDDERLRNERRKAQEARERYVRQAMGMDSNGAVTYGRTPTASMRRNSAEGSESYGTNPYQATGANQYMSNTNTYRSSSFNDNLHAAASGPNREFVQPSNQEEEQLQMQIALAESQREAEDEERRRRNDDLKLKIALERSVHETPPDGGLPSNSQLFDLPASSHPLDPSLFPSHGYNSSSAWGHDSSYLPPTTTTTASSIGWNPVNNRPSTHLGFTTATNDPWTLESGNDSSSRITTNDPWNPTTATTGWQPAPPSSSMARQPHSATQVNPWSGGSDSATNNGNAGLSLSMADPWGLNAGHPKTTSLPPIEKSANNELDDFFGASAAASSTLDHQHHGSSNPWNMTSTNNANAPHTSNSPGSISPPNTIPPFSSGSGGILYPTLTGVNASHSGNSSPFPSGNSASRKTPESFLGDKFINLVNLDSLVTEPKSTNPFGSTTSRAPPNPFASTMKAPTLEQLSSSTNVGFSSGVTLPPPLIPASFGASSATVPPSNTRNPFM